MVSQAKADYTSVVSTLKQRKQNLRCSEIRALLERLKFVVAPKGSAGHRAYKHPEIPDFFGGSYNCGHGADGQVKPSYITNILRVIEGYEDKLISL